MNGPMSIDAIMHPSTPTDAEIKAALRMTIAVAETIREADEIPSGTLYASLMGRVTMEGYTKLLNTLKNADLVSEHNHVLRWIGPSLEDDRRHCEARAIEVQFSAEESYQVELDRR
jgi:hypothetical protein